MLEEWQPLSAALLNEKMLQTPFVQSMVDMYHELSGFKAKRQHLSQIAPFFPYRATMQAFGVSRWIVWSAILHHKGVGSDRPPPPARAHFRIKPEQECR